MITEKLHRKYLEWTSDEDNDPPDSLVMNPSDFEELQKYLSELERNESLPLTWLHDIKVIVSTGATEIKIGILL